jgi:mono/diheme cytochrome c family protein
MRKVTFRATVLLAALAATGCEKKAEPRPAQARGESAATPTAPAVVPAATVTMAGSGQAEKYFKTRCVVCHGASGAGDGPGAAALDPKPRAFADPNWQSSTTDEQIEKVILGGGAAVGKSTAMAPNPDLQSKPELLKDLVKLIRGFKKT